MSLFEAELRVRFNSTPDRPWYFLSGPRPNNPSEPGTSLRYEDGKFIWQIASAYEDETGLVTITSGPVDIQVGEWFSVRVKFETNNLQGDILFGESYANASIKASQTQEDEMYFSMAPVGEIGWNGASGDYSVFRLYTNDAGKEGWFDLFEREVQSPNTEEIEPALGEGENLKWESRDWKSSADGGFMHRMVRKYAYSSSPDNTPSSARYRRRWGYYNGKENPILPNSSVDPEFSTNLPGVKIANFYSYFASNLSNFAISSATFRHCRCYLEGDIDCRDYKLRATNLTLGNTVTSSIHQTNSLGFSYSDALELFPNDIASTQTHDFILEFTPATLQEQIEAKLKPAYEKLGTHYNCDDEPVTLDEKGFIFYPKESVELPAELPELPEEPAELPEED